jgi:hypothetical protein
VWSYTSTRQYAFMAWCSVKAQGQVYLYLCPTDETGPILVQSVDVKYVKIEIQLCMFVCVDVELSEVMTQTQSVCMQNAGPNVK